MSLIELSLRWAPAETARCTGRTTANQGRDVALEALPIAFAADPERLARFRHEGRALASLNHPNIAAIYGLEESEGATFLVLELVQGETLRSPLPVGKTLDYVLRPRYVVITHGRLRSRTHPVT